VLGSGREELAPLVFGATKRRGGTVRVDATSLDPGDVAGAIDARVGLVPANRVRQGAIVLMNVRENLTITKLKSVERWLGWIPRRAERAEAQRWMRSVDLRPADPERPLAQFSGGNQQKVVLAKWLRTEPRVLLLDEPTAGVDVGAKVAIYDLVRAAADAGTSVVVCSSDTKELAELCDRVLVLDRGRCVGELTGVDLTEEAVLHCSLDAQPNRDRVAS
jgi:ribose transport system ATP-binding protein